MPKRPPGFLSDVAMAKKIGPIKPPLFGGVATMTYGVYKNIQRQFVNGESETLSHEGFHVSRSDVIKPGRKIMIRDTEDNIANLKQALTDKINRALEEKAATYLTDEEMAVETGLPKALLKEVYQYIKSNAPSALRDELGIQLPDKALQNLKGKFLSKVGGLQIDRNYSADIVAIAHYLSQERGVDIDSLLDRELSDDEELVVSHAPSNTDGYFR